MSRAGWFITGAIAGIIVFAPAGAYLVAKVGGIAMATTAKPLPLEETFARTALHASIGNAAAAQDPLPMTEENMLAGARVYVRNCAMCHGVPGQPKTQIAKGEFPSPPQLFEQNQMVTDDPEGVTHWKVAHGIRLSGMPGFGETLSHNEKWQVTMLLAHADKRTPAVDAVLNQSDCEDRSAATQARSR